MKQQADFTDYANGIPCGVVIDYFYSTAGDRGACNRDDYEGYTDMEWHLVDRKGYKADWLSKKLTDADISRIEDRIVEIMEDDDVY